MSEGPDTRPKAAREPLHSSHRDRGEHPQYVAEDARGLGSLLGKPAHDGDLEPRFADRRDAGRRLAVLLMRTRCEDPVVVGISTDGVPVAAEVARALEAPLDVLLVERVRAPSNPERAIGAVAEGESCVIDDETVDRLELGAKEVQEALADANERLGEQQSRSLFGRFRVAVRGRSVILVDDGITGTHRARAAAQSLRNRGAARVVLAVPVAERAAAQLLRAFVDDVVCARMPERMLAVEQGYEDATPTSEQELRALMSGHAGAVQREVVIESPPDVLLHGELTVPWGAYARGVVAFAGGFGTSRANPGALKIAARMNHRAIATLRLDLFGPDESIDPARALDEELLSARLLATTKWLRRQPETAGIAIGYLGAGIDAAAALLAAARLKAGVCAVVSHSGRVDLATERLEQVLASVLLIVGGADAELVELNRAAERRLRCESELVVLPGTSHPFDEPGALDEVARLTAEWFTAHLREPAPGIGGDDQERASAAGKRSANVQIASLR